MENKESDGIKMLKIKYQGKSVEVLYDPSKGLPKENVINEAVGKLKEQIVAEKQKELEAEKAKEAREGHPAGDNSKGDKKNYMDERVEVVLDNGAGVDVGARDKDLEKTVAGAGSNEDAAKAVEQTQTQLETAVNSEVKQPSLDDGVMKSMQDQLRQEDEKQDKQEQPESEKNNEEITKTSRESELDKKLRDDVAGKAVSDTVKTAEEIDKKGGIAAAGQETDVKKRKKLIKQVLKASGQSVESIAKQRGEKIVVKPKPQPAKKIDPKANKENKENKENKDNEAMRQIFLKNGRMGNVG